MRRGLRHFALALLVAKAHAIQGVSDGGGRDVSVALFSTHGVRSVTVTPFGDSAWKSRCASCPHEPFTAPVNVKGHAEMFAGGALSVTETTTGETRSASGLWHFRGHAVRQDVDVVLTLPSERYVASVVAAEAAKDEPAQSMQAMAILARTYELNGVHYRAQPGHLVAELCDSTQCQVMSGASAGSAAVAAARATAGETIWLQKRRAEVYFSQSCGGVTEDAAAAGLARSPVPYLRSHADPYCLRKDAAAWHAEVPLAKLAALADSWGWRLPFHVISVRVESRSASHRALQISFTGPAGPSVRLSAATLRFAIGRGLGWSLVRSDAYDVAVRNGSLVFDGRGHGHGVGLCQVGAAEMAREGKSAREILAFYFPKTVVRVTSTDEGWSDQSAAGLDVHATQRLTEQRRLLLQQTWNEAQGLFTPRTMPSPSITFAPTTEMFRQITAQPGWELACTKGSAIVLQPDPVLATSGSSLHRVLLHEMLHVLVESEAVARTPLWLREGVVEYLADTQRHRPTEHSGMPSLEVIESGLSHPTTVEEGRRAHEAAAARVAEMVRRYGFSTVRGWISAGMPARVS